ncbi:MAG: hypothetical protein R3C16_06665 [Hyphomonadaceae bacterium]
MLKVAQPLLFALMLAGCMSPVDLSMVEAAAAQFHQRQAAGDDRAIYDNADPAFRSAAEFAVLERVNGAVRNAQGCGAPSRDPASWTSTVNTSGHFITVVYGRQCAEGAITETMVFRVSEGGAALLNYNANGIPLMAREPAPAPAPAPSPESTPPEDVPASPA